MVKFNDDIVDQLCKARENGLNITDCANLSNIDRQTLYNWLDKGKKAKSGKYKKFYEKFQKANSKFKFYHLDKITKDESWQASAWILERTFPDDYGKKDKHEIKADVENKHNLSNLFDEDTMRKIVDERYSNDK